MPRGQGADDIRTFIEDSLGTGTVVTMLLKGEPEDGQLRLYIALLLWSHTFVVLVVHQPGDRCR